MHTYCLFVWQIVLFSQCWYSCNNQSTESVMGVPDNCSRNLARQQDLWFNRTKLSTNLWCRTSSASLYNNEQYHRPYHCGSWISCQHYSGSNSFGFVMFPLETSSTAGKNSFCLNCGFHIVVFIPTSRGIFLLDSHIHEEQWSSFGFCWVAAFMHMSFSRAKRNSIISNTPLGL